MNYKLYQWLKLTFACALALAMGSSVAVAQEQGAFTVSGRIVDATSKAPLIGVSVVVEGTTNGVASDMDGNYSIEDTADFSVYVPKTEQYFTTSLAIIPLQLMGYYVSVAKGLDVDKPRNLAKSVTVE